MRPERLHPAVVLATVIALSAAAMPLHSVFSGWSWAVPVLGAIVVSTLITATAEWVGRRRWWLVLAGSAVGFVVWTFGAIARDTISSTSAAEPWRTLRGGLTDGWNALLADTVPLLDDQTALIFVALVVWVAAAVSVHVLARWGSPLGALVAVPMVLAVAVAAALPSQLVAAGVGGLVGAALLVVVATTRRVEGDHWGIGRVGLLGVVVVASAALATVAGGAAERTRPDPADPRSARRTEVATLEIPDLLARFSAEIDADDTEPVMVVRNPDGSAPDPLRLRLQVYDTYDGERWISTTDYRATAELPEPAGLAAGESIDVRITDLRLPTPLLPLPDRVVALSASDLRWNDETQTGLGTTGASLAVTGVLVESSGLEATAPDTDGIDERYLLIPDTTPDALRAYTEQVTVDSPDTVSSVLAVAEATRGLGRDDSRPPGHSLGRLLADLGEETPTGPEQLAAMTALMVRTIGVPSRVVVGYVVDGEEVATTDLHAWVEVPFEGRGWVAIDPAPLYSEAVGTVLTDEPTVTSTTLPTGAVVDTPVEPRELDPDERPDTETSSGGRIGGWITLAVAAAVIVLTLVSLIVIRILRRRRRQRGDSPDELVLGAWAELVDRLRENGSPPGRSATTDDVIALADGIDPAVASAARPLADLAAEALHAPLAPTRAEAKVAWDRLEETEGALVEVRGRMVIARRLVDPRVLRHRAPAPPPRDRSLVASAGET